MSGSFDLRGYIGNLRLANMGSDKVIEMRSVDVRLHFSDLTLRGMSASRPLTEAGHDWQSYRLR